MSEVIDRDTILKSLTLINDQPNENINYFYFNKFKTNFINLLENEIKPPFSILLDGEWGSGKTSLITNIYNEINKSSCVIFYNPWYYEGLNPISSLLQLIINRFQNNENNENKITIHELTELSIDLQSYQTGLTTLERIKKRYSTSIINIPKIKEKLKKLP